MTYYSKSIVVRALESIRLPGPDQSSREIQSRIHSVVKHDSEPNPAVAFCTMPKLGITELQISKLQHLDCVIYIPGSGFHVRQAEGRHEHENGLYFFYREAFNHHMNTQQIAFDTDSVI